MMELRRKMEIQRKKVENLCAENINSPEALAESRKLNEIMGEYTRKLNALNAQNVPAGRRKPRKMLG